MARGEVTENELVGWHHRLNGHEFEQTRGNSEGEGSLACCSLWSCRVEHDLAIEQEQLHTSCVPACFVEATCCSVSAPVAPGDALTVKCGPWCWISLDSVYPGAALVASVAVSVLGDNHPSRHKQHSCHLCR